MPSAPLATAIAARRRAIFAECRTAGLDDDARRYLVAQLTGRKSLADCTPGELSQVLDHLKRRNGTHRAQRASNEWSFVFAAAPERQALLKKIYRLAQRIGALQAPPVPVMPKHYIEGVTAQMRGTTAPLEFCDPGQLTKVVQALAVHVERHGG
jgi:phage gp16-like protein